MRRNRILFPVLLLALLLASCPAQSDSSVSTETNMRYRTSPIVVDTASSDPGGLKLRLSEGAEQPGSGAPVAVAPAVSLSPAETQRVLDRLPALPANAGDTQAFALPKESLPPPRPGQTIEASFPPSTTAEAPQQPAAGPLEVVRSAPQGEVALAPSLDLTFSQPMVALTAHEDLAAQGVPVVLSPAVAGTWRWVGTQTLMFEPRTAPGTAGTRFPMATQYTVTVPATTTSATGGKLAEPVTWTFTTPPPQLGASYPTGGPYRLDPLLFAAFDQQIDPAAVLSTIQVKAGALTPALRLATADEIKADATVSQLSANAGEQRWLAFRTVDPLPAGTGVTVTIGPGTPSAEGPLKTTVAQSFSFSTYSPLAVLEASCGWGGNCAPLMPWYIQFNNPLDASAFQDTQVHIEPALPGAKIQVYGNSLSIQGNSQGRTTYQVTLDAGLKDQFGQALGQAQTVTFKVGSASPAITVQGNGFVVLDPTARPALSVFTLNYSRLSVQLYKVRPEDWPAYRTWVQNYYQTQTPAAPPGEQVLSKPIQINAKADELVETAIDLSPALQDGLGQVIVVIDPQPRPANQQRQLIQSWVQSSRIGLDAFVDPTQMVAWANSLLDGSPLPGVALSLLPDGKTATTGEDGLATLPLPDTAGAGLLVATKDGDTAILPQNTYWWDNSGWQRRPQADSLRWAVFDDRGMYRPGEEVHVKGWIRRIGGGTGGDVMALDGATRQVSYRLQDPQGNEVRNGLAQVNALGGFDLVLTLPEAMNLGPAMLTLEAMGSGSFDGYQYTHSFQVQEFRRPEFEVSASASEGPHILGGHAIASVEATYYAGGGLAGAEVTWQVSTATAQYSPPGWDEFSFGTWTPWWGDWMKPYQPQSPPVTFTGRTDASGKHELRIDFDSIDTPQPATVSAQATVMDVNRQAWTAQTTLLVHPADLYVGLRSDRIFVQQDDPLRVDAILVDLDGKPVAGRNISLKAARLDWQYKNGSWQEVETVVQPCTVVSAAEPVQCTFETPEGGTYRITATIEDEQGRTNQSQITRWVSGSSRPPARQVEQEEVTLIPDRKEYRPGDTAQILVQAPFYPAEGVLTLRRSGIVSTERFTMTGPTYTASVPIEDAYTPNVYVQIDLVGAAPRLDDAGNVDESLPKRPAFATGSLNLSVPPLSRTLHLEVTPRDKALEPGGQTTVDVVLKDAEGKPVEGGEVAVVVVDEAVLALTGYTLPDPMAIFYGQRSPDTQDYHLRADVMLANPDLLQPQMVQEAAMDMAMPAAAPAATEAPALRGLMKAEASAAYGGAGEAGPQIAVRTDFNALATFAPSLPTDAGGHAQVEVKLPDNLTRYRVMAVAVADGKQFGAGESTITARLPLMVRASPPRFLNFGDRFELPIVLQNQTDADIQVDVAVTATNVALTAGQGRRVTVPANDRVEVRFPATTEQPGTARFQVGAVAGEWADAAQFELPVWTPATTEAFATYGQIDEGAIAQPVIAPTDVYTQFGGLEITTSSTALQALTDAVLYLVSYPFECSEQLASRVMAVASLRDVLTAFKAEGLPSPDEMQASVARDIERLHGLQNDDGGFGFWRRGDESWPYLSIHVAHALQRARDKDYKVPDDMLQRSQDYLRNIEQHIPSWYGEDARRSLIAYALYVRNLMGDKDTARARQLIQEAGPEKLPSEAVGWLLSVLTGDAGSGDEIAAIRRYLNNRVTETAGAASFVTSYGDDEYLLLHTNRRTDAVILDALMADQPQSDLIPKLVQGLLAHRTSGRWDNTQENAFVLLALDRYFNTYEAQTPDFVARLWLGDQYAGEATFQGRSTDRQEVDIPMAVVAGTTETQNLILSKEGAGRLYYRLGMSYAPKDLHLEPADHGFTVERSYEAVDDPAEVRRDEDGTWHVKAGALVRVRLTMVAPARRYHVALVDPLPAGFEALNPALAVTGSVPPDQDPASPANRYRWWWGPWYQYQNLRDQRAEAFTSLLWEGVYTYSYVARATTPGEFIVPPAKAEEMYAPETFGRGASDLLIVE